MTLVCDNLNTHTKGAFYEAFEPDQARAYVKRIKFCYTPKHGSWLNAAECELSCLTRQCLSDRRIGKLTDRQSEIKAWSDATNAKQRAVDWQFRIDDAHIKLQRLYPKIKLRLDDALGLPSDHPPTATICRAPLAQPPSAPKINGCLCIDRNNTERMGAHPVPSEERAC